MFFSLLLLKGTSSVAIHFWHGIKHGKKKDTKSRGFLANISVLQRCCSTFKTHIFSSLKWAWLGIRATVSAAFNNIYSKFTAYHVPAESISKNKNGKILQPTLAPNHKQFPLGKFEVTSLRAAH